MNLGILAAKATDGSFWLPPEGASTVAPGVDNAYYFIYYTTLFFFCLVVGLMLLFVWKYRRRPGHVVNPNAATHNTALEITWTVIPLILVLVMFAMGFRVFMDMQTPPSDAYDVRVQAQKWSWSFKYPNGVESPDLHVPKDRPVRLTMVSTDVIHSFYVPTLRVQQNVVPGRLNFTWFQATKTGEYEIFCTQYCGDQHASMTAKVIVEEPGLFSAWLANANKLEGTPVEIGAKLYQTQGCAQCHSIDGTNLTGPTWKNLWGHRVPLSDGTEVLSDDAYIHTSILNPAAQIVKGYQNVMPPYEGRLSEQKVAALTAYIQSLSDEGRKVLEKSATPQAAPSTQTGNK